MNSHRVIPPIMVCLIITFTNPAAAELNPLGEKGHDFTLGVQGKSFTVTFPVGEAEYTDTVTFGPDDSFTMTFFSSIEDSSGFYLDLFGILFFANLSGILMFEPFSFSFYGIYLNSKIVGVSIINFGDARSIGKFNGTEF